MKKEYVTFLNLLRYIVNMKKIMFVPMLLIFLVSAPIALANNSKEQNENHFNPGKILNLTKQTNNSIIKEEDKNENKSINLNNFFIWGKITSISSDSIVVMDQTVYIDHSKVSKFKQKGILETDKVVKVKGVIIDGKKYATEIEVKKNDGLFRIRIKDGEDEDDEEEIISPTPTSTPSAVTPTTSPTITPTESITPSVSPSISPSVTPTPTATSESGLSEENKEEISQILKKLQDLLAFLRDFI